MSTESYAIQRDKLVRFKGNKLQRFNTTEYWKRQLWNSIHRPLDLVR